MSKKRGCPPLPRLNGEHLKEAMAKAGKKPRDLGVAVLKTDTEDYARWVYERTRKKNPRGVDKQTVLAIAGYLNVRKEFLLLGGDDFMTEADRIASEERELDLKLSDSDKLDDAGKRSPVKELLRKDGFFYKGVTGTVAGTDPYYWYQFSKSGRDYCITVEDLEEIESVCADLAAAMLQRASLGHLKKNDIPVPLHVLPGWRPGDIDSGHSPEHK